MKTYREVKGFIHALIFLLLFMIIKESYCQGMVPLSPVMDHSKNTKKTKDDKPLSPEKIKAHMKIASSHLQENAEENSRISQKDKPPELQNSDKHMAEEFVLKFLLKQYPKSDNPLDKVEILQNLENFSHKLENGLELFKGTSALKEILLPALNSSSEEVRKSSCGVFAIAAQNNREVQELAVGAGVVRAIVHLIRNDQGVRAKALWALGAILRNFPKGQAKFIKDGGIPALVKVATYSETRKRAVNFITDLLQERNHCKESIQEKVEDDVLDLDPCEDFDLLEKSLEESGWCDLLSDSVRNIPGFDTEDQLLTVEAVSSSISFCRGAISPLVHIFQHLLNKVEKDEDFESEATLIRGVIQQLKNHDEL